MGVLIFFGDSSYVYFLRGTDIWFGEVLYMYTTDYRVFVHLLLILYHNIIYIRIEVAHSSQVLTVLISPQISVFSSTMFPY